jgi:glutamate racemase
MTRSQPIFIADSCIGGLSVVSSLWNAGDAGNAIFLADYAINPLGVKSNPEIADVVERWLRSAENHSDTLVMACNTLSVQHRKLQRSKAALSGPEHVVSMVDCFEALVRIQKPLLADKDILIVGTRYTAAESLYPDIIRSAIPGARTKTVAATELERVIARFEPWNSADDSVLTRELRLALQETDIAILACTCFPMVMASLRSLFPHVTFLDPGAYCAGLLPKQTAMRNNRLRIKVTGDVVSARRAVEFAASHLGTGDIECCT